LGKLKLRVPASSGNLGPGFDCLGLALDIYNTVVVERSDRLTISVSGEGKDALSLREDNRVYQSIAAVYESLEQRVPPLDIVCHNEIPLRRGLGSSAAATAAGLVAANLLCGEPLSAGGLLKLGAELEGHPDNIAAALLGGCQVAVVEGDRVLTARVRLPRRLRVALFIPDFELPTAEARAILPQQVGRADVVFNLGRVALLLSALAQGRLDYLKVATQDRVHQPARQALFPAMGAIMEAALEAGAVGAFLSGAGSTIVALTEGRAKAVARAMAEAAARAGVGGRTREARPSALGVHQVPD